ncbi:hypothetical protein LCGC14_1854530, partial [marine sediment metagenome]
MTDITDIGLTEIIAGQNDRTRFDQAALKEQGDDQPRLIRTLEFEYYAIQRAVCPPVLDTHAQRTLYPLASLAAGYQERSLTVKPVTKDPTFRCPTCGDDSSLREKRGHYLLCDACGSRWRVGGDSFLTNMDSGERRSSTAYFHQICALP